jgi:predicted membrane protein (TIGR00267 family)
MLRATRGRGRSSEAPRPPAERNASEREDAAPVSTRGFWARARYYDQLTGVFAISRRYFVIGAFDGALTVLGLILGAAGYSTNPALILSAGLATSVALAISSTFGAYEAERVEQDLAHQEVQTAMLRTVGGDKVRAHRFATIVSSLIHGVAPLVAGLLPLIPFLFVPTVIPFYDAILIAAGMTLVFLFALGAYLGTITKKGMIKAGVRLVAVAILTAGASFVIGGHAFR